VEQDDATNLPLGVSPYCRNVKFSLTRVRTRDGIQNLHGFTLPDAGGVTGLSMGKVGGNPDVQIPVAFSSVGNLYKEFPAGSGTVQQISSAQVPLPANASMQAAAAFNKHFLAFSDLKNSLASPAVLNLETGVLDPLSMAPQGSASAVMSSTGVGNICAGLRYLVVLFVNRNGYISGMTTGSVVSVNLAVSGQKLQVATIPRGPANTAARICAFTPAGQLNQLAGTGISNAGPFFWIPPLFPNGIFDLSAIGPGVSNADVVNGVQMTSTLINDNATTTAVFNFTDDYLKSFTLYDVSGYFRKIQVPPCSDVYYAKSLRRMFYAADNLPSGWYVSWERDPESIYGDVAGIVQCAENNGENRTAVREYDGTVYLMKERSGHTLTASTDDPGKWEVNEKWTGSGPCGPRAVDVGTSFMCYVHRSGVYIFNGSKPFRISKEIPVTWSQINWAYQHTIWVLIDDETQEIRIGVPYGKSTVPSVVLKLNYEESPTFEAPIHFSPYVGNEIAAGQCYKWSIDDIAANLAIRAERTLQNPSATMDPATIQAQILFASANPDGAVSPIVPGAFDDNGLGIDSVYETAAPKQLMTPAMLGGVQANIDGDGEIAIEVLALRAAEQKQGGVPLPAGSAQANVGFVAKLKPCQAGVPYSAGGRGQNERFRLRVSNNKQKGVWFDIKWAAIMARPVSTARPR
jgi:hypothetical protein